jgi:N-acetyl-alpha-D-glucosaminyl L-malate synthase BshA
VATELGIKLAQRGHEVHFITYAQPFRLPYFMEGIFYHEVEMPAYPLFDHSPYPLALAVAMHKAAVHNEIDLLHVHYAIPHATSAWIAREMLGGESFRFITTLHGTDITLVGQDPSFQAITQFSIAKSDGITAVSHYLRDETVEHFGVPREAIEVIPNVVDLELYNRERFPCHRAKFAAPGEKLLMHVSNFRPVKRLEDVVRVFARVVRQIPSRLLLVGDGPDRARAQLLAEELGVAARVLFLGKQESVAELLSCADLLVLPSTTEAFGLAALEAMACGTPVVATNVGGVPEVVSQGEAGYLTPIGAIEEMAEAAIELLADPDRWTRASIAARSAAERFNADLIVPQYEAYYSTVLNR